MFQILRGWSAIFPISWTTKIASKILSEWWHSPSVHVQLGQRDLGEVIIRILKDTLISTSQIPTYSLSLLKLILAKSYIVKSLRYSIGVHSQNTKLAFLKLTEKDSFPSLSLTSEISILYHDISDLSPQHILEGRAIFLWKPKFVFQV